MQKYFKQELARLLWACADYSAVVNVDPIIQAFHAAKLLATFPFIFNATRPLIIKCRKHAATGQVARVIPSKCVLRIAKRALNALFLFAARRDRGLVSKRHVGYYWQGNAMTTFVYIV